MIMALAACEENGGKEALDPVLNLSEKVIQATADGGVYELACSIDNPVEGAVLDLTQSGSLPGNSPVRNCP